jgi:hypothetical protein
LAAASVPALGIAPWIAFVRELDAASSLIGDGEVPLDRMVTVFAALRLADVSIAISSLAQSSVTLFALGAIAYVWRQRASLPWRGSALAVAIPLTTLPMAWLAWAGLATGFRRGEVPLLVAAWVSPVVGWLLAEQSHVLLTPVVLALLLLSVLRRVRSSAPLPTPAVSLGAASLSADLSNFRHSST